MLKLAGFFLIEIKYIKHNTLKDKKEIVWISFFVKIIHDFAMQKLIKLWVILTGDPRIDTSVSTFQNNYASTSGKNVKVLIPLPVIANPAPRVSDITWTGPTRESVEFVVYQRGAIYKHWINTTVAVYDHSYFGNFTLKHKNETLVTITIHAQGMFFKI